MNAMIFRTLMAAGVAAIAAFAPGPGWTDGDQPDANPEAPAAFPSDMTAITIDGVEFRLKMERTYGYGEKPVVLIEARNPGDAEATVRTSLSVTTIPETSFVSRVPRAPQPVEVHAQPVEIALAASETRVFRIELPATLLAAPASNEPMMVRGPGEFRVHLGAAPATGNADGDEIARAIRAIDTMRNGNGNAAAPAPAAPDGTMARFSVDPARVYRAEHRIERDATGKPVAVLVDLRNLSPIALRFSGAEFHAHDGKGRVELAGHEQTELKPGESTTIRLQLDGISDGARLQGWVLVDFLFQALEIDLGAGSEAHGS